MYSCDFLLGGGFDYAGHATPFLSRYEEIDQDYKYWEAWEKYLRSERDRKADIHTDDKRPTVQDNKSAYLSES